ncbi:MAG TPA: hypothetical protein VFF81_13745, partial [Noviherbaspirillum sp.]|nr:hypothetical protein [Noviherbaspirillum sp.]
MSEITNKEMDNRRRQMLLGGLAAGATGLLQACGGGGASGSDDIAADTSAAGAIPAQTSEFAAGSVAVTTPAAIPANAVNLSEFGGVPGAAPSTIISAFNQAFSRLKSLGGGTLT